jgi:hypothetical protein
MIAVAVEPLVYVSFIVGFEQQQPIFIKAAKIFHALSNANKRFCSSIFDFKRLIAVFLDEHHLQKAPVLLQIITADFSHSCPHLQRNLIRVFCIIAGYSPIIVAPVCVKASYIFILRINQQNFIISNLRTRSIRVCFAYINIIFNQ